jgi:hypothetical protein
MGKAGLNMNGGKQGMRILYVDKSSDSNRAKRILSSHHVNYTVCVVSSEATTPPTLVTSEGEFPGVENIGWYAKHFANGKWEKELEP